jgi:hypothetical protein
MSEEIKLPINENGEVEIPTELLEKIDFGKCHIEGIEPERITGVNINLGDMNDKLQKLMEAIKLGEEVIEEPAPVIHECVPCGYKTARKQNKERHDLSKKHLSIVQGIPNKKVYSCTYIDCPFTSLDASNHRRHVALPHPLQHKFARRIRKPKIIVEINNIEVNGRNE